MRLRVQYTTVVSDFTREAVAAHYGIEGLADRATIQRALEGNGLGWLEQVEQWFQDSLDEGSRS